MPYTISAQRRVIIHLGAVISARAKSLCREDWRWSVRHDFLFTGDPWRRTPSVWIDVAYKHTVEREERIPRTFTRGATWNGPLSWFRGAQRAGLPFPSHGLSRDKREVEFSSRFVSRDGIIIAANNDGCNSSWQPLVSRSLSPSLFLLLSRYEFRNISARLFRCVCRGRNVIIVRTIIYS